MTGTTTLLDVLQAFSGEGDTARFWPVADGVRCGSCDATTPADLIAFAAPGLEGATAPDDTAAVLPVTCPHCHASGTAVLRYGPGAGAEDATVLAAIADRHPAEETATAP